MKTVLLMLKLPEDIHRRLKTHVALQSTNMRAWCVKAILEQMKRDKSKVEEVRT